MAPLSRNQGQMHLLQPPQPEPSGAQPAPRAQRPEDAAGLWRAGAGLTCGPGPGRSPASCATPAAPPSATPPTVPPAVPRLALGALCTSLEAHTHSIIPGARREGGWRRWTAGPFQAPRRHFVRSGNLPTSPLKTQRCVPASRG